MSLGRLKKQIHKFSQRINEIIINNNDPISEEHEFLSQKTKVHKNLVEDLIKQTNHVLCPSHAQRVKIALNNLVPFGSSTRWSPVPPEKYLASTLTKRAIQLGSTSLFGQALNDTSECMREICYEKKVFEEKIREDFLKNLEDKTKSQIKNITNLKKKMKNKKLDYDFKKKRFIPEKKISSASSIERSKVKFETSLDKTNSAMKILVHDQFLHIDNLLRLATCQLDYHTKCAQHLANLQHNLFIKKAKSENFVFPYKQKSKEFEEEMENSNNLSIDDSINCVAKNKKKNRYFSQSYIHKIKKKNSEINNEKNGKVGGNFCRKEDGTQERKLNQTSEEKISNEMISFSLKEKNKKKINSIPKYLNYKRIYKEDELKDHHWSQTPNLPSTHQKPINTFSFQHKKESFLSSFFSSSHNFLNLKKQKKRKNSSPPNNHSLNISNKFYLERDTIATKRMEGDRKEKQKMKAEAIHNFEAENENELNFSVGQIDNNWMEGKINEKCGIFPLNCVRLIKK